VERLAIFIDGGYLVALAEKEFETWLDCTKFSEATREVVANGTPEPPYLLRTYYCDCRPYQSDTPTEEEAQRFAARRKLFAFLRRLPRFAVREGRLNNRGTNKQGEAIFQQKRADQMTGLDFASVSTKRQIADVAMLSGDSDLIPALEIAGQEGISVWLLHGPRKSKVDGRQTYAGELWNATDERLE